MSRVVPLVGVLVLSSVLPSRAHAFLRLPKRWVLTGLSVGYLNDGDHGLLVGVELSYAERTHDVSYWGAYLDIRYDRQADGAMISLGPEFFAYVFGVDAGLVLRAGREGVGVGVRARGCVSVGMLGLCGGGGVTSDLGPFAEITALVKYPHGLD